MARVTVQYLLQMAPALLLNLLHLAGIQDDGYQNLFNTHKTSTMKKLLPRQLILLALFFTVISTQAQQKIKDGTGSPATSLPAAGSILEVQSTQAGIRFPQVTLTSTIVWAPLLGSGTAATSPGMTVYNTNTAITSGTGTNSQFYGILIGGKGEYYWDGFGWVAKGGNQAQTVETWIKAVGVATQAVGATAAAATVLDFSVETA